MGRHSPILLYRFPVQYDKLAGRSAAYMGKRVMTQPSIVKLVGRIDNVTSAEMEASINAALDTSPRALLLDFTEVTFVSSIGLRVLLMAAKRCRKQNAAFALHSVAPQIVTLFGVSGLNAFFPIYPNCDAALSAIA